MITIEMIEQNVPTTAAAIATFERNRNISLPESYKSFLQSMNGGVPANAWFPIEGFGAETGGDLGHLQVFSGIGTRWPTTELSYAIDLYAGGIPERLVPIACDDFGSYICLDLRQGAESVVFWDKRHFWGTGEWREQDLYPVADTFEAFLASLRPNPY